MTQADEREKVYRITGSYHDFLIQSLRDDPELAHEYWMAAQSDGDFGVVELALQDLREAGYVE